MSLQRGKEQIELEASAKVGRSVRDRKGSKPDQGDYNRT